MDAVFRERPLSDELENLGGMPPNAFDIPAADHMVLNDDAAAGAVDHPMAIDDEHLSAPFINGDNAWEFHAPTQDAELAAPDQFVFDGIEVLQHLQFEQEAAEWFCTTYATNSRVEVIEGIDLTVFVNCQ